MSDLYDLVDDQRQFLGSLDRVTAQQMSTAYAAVLKQAKADYAAFSAKVEAYRAAHPHQDPTKASPSRHWVYQQERYQTLISQLTANVTMYTNVATGAITNAQRASMQKAQSDTTSIISASMGGGDKGAGLLSMAVLPEQAINAVVGFTSDGTPLNALLKQRAKVTLSDVNQTLINGVALGHSPFDVAKRLDDQLGTMHWQNLRLARTEMMRAYREAQRVNMLQNADVLSGWKWSSALDRRSCTICIGQHGKVFPIDHVAPANVPPDVAQHKGLAETYAAPPKEKVAIG